MSPDFGLERELWQQDFLVLGVDEVGRGALAGPVVAAAVAILPFSLFCSNLPTIVGRFEPDWEGLGIDDSKKLAPKKREELAKLIKRFALTWGVGKTGAGVIDRRGIVWATQRAMRLAVKTAQQRLLRELGGKSYQIRSFLLIDAFHVKYVPGVGLKNQKAVIHGDQRSLSIAAASIVAKVYRDRLMEKLSEKCLRWSLYGWEKNKGYGTAFHREMIKKHGLSRYHRRSFRIE
jgi:ribonuclease HII